MAETPQTSQTEDEAGELRSKLVKRLAFAGVLVALLLGTLTFFDYLSSPPDDSETRIFTEPVPVAPRKEVSQPVKTTDSLPEPPAQPMPEPVVETPPPPPQVAAVQPVPEVKPEKVIGKVTEKAAETPVEKRPAATSTAAVVRGPAKVTGSPPVSASATPTARPARPVVEEPTYPPSMPPPAPLAAQPATSPSARVTEIRRSTPQVVPPSSMARLFSGFSLQAGVFASTQRAEELHAKLTLSGLPSTLETRVQVGPFRSRQEAEMAQEKLRELGVETVLLAPKGAKP